MLLREAYSCTRCPSHLKTSKTLVNPSYPATLIYICFDSITQPKRPLCILHKKPRTAILWPKRLSTIFYSYAYKLWLIITQYTLLLSLLLSIRYFYLFTKIIKYLHVCKHSVIVVASIKYPAHNEQTICGLTSLIRIFSG